MDANGTNIVQLTNEVGDDSQPSWSADGTKIAYSTFRSGNVEIFTMNPDGTGKTNVTNATGADTRPAYSRGEFMDLLSIFAWTSTRDGNPEIYISNATGAAVRLTDNLFIDENPAFR
jgi:TolB protein